MPDNWTFVAAAYAVAAVAFGAYWRWLGRKERDITTLRGRNDGRNPAGRPTAGLDAAGRNTTERNPAVRIDRASRSQQPSRPGPPRPESSSEAPVQ
jgi:hypothetical protein